MWRMSMLAMATLVLASGGLSWAEDAPGTKPGGPLKAAASNPPSCFDFKWGDYQPLTFWRRVKLGTAYYVNPDTARRASVSYVYSPTLMKDPGKAKQIFADFEMGDVSLAQKRQHGVFFVVPPEEAKTTFMEMATQPNFDAFLDAKGYVIAASRDSLAGVKATEVVVSFDPTTSCVQPEDKGGKAPHPK